MKAGHGYGSMVRISSSMRSSNSTISVRATIEGSLTSVTVSPTNRPGILCSHTFKSLASRLTVPGLHVLSLKHGREHFPRRCTHGFHIFPLFFVNLCVCQATEEKAENARLSSFVGALALGDLVKSTLGPKGMNKILQSMSSGDINVTNDGATILKAIQLDNAAAKILVNISKVQDDEVGDGTTSVTVLAAELLREAEKLIGMKIHPQTIVEGYRIASVAALKALEDAAVDHGCVGCLRMFILGVLMSFSLCTKV